MLILTKWLTANLYSMVQNWPRSWLARCPWELARRRWRRVDWGGARFGRAARLRWCEVAGRPPGTAGAPAAPHAPRGTWILRGMSPSRLRRPPWTSVACAHPPRGGGKVARRVRRPQRPGGAGHELKFREKKKILKTFEIEKPLHLFKYFSSCFRENFYVDSWQIFSRICAEDGDFMHDSYVEF